MRQIAGAAALFSVLTGCGGQRTVAPSTASDPVTVTLAHAQGALCDANGGSPALARCAAAGITATVATVRVRVPQNGAIQLSAITRYLGFEEYARFTMTCDGVPTPLTALSGKPVTQPAWFASVPGIRSTAGAVDLEYTGRGSANSSCELAFSFDLDPGLPYTPYDLTIDIEAR